jgi:hypothetical protein
LFFPQLASIDGVEFANGVIEAEIAGAPAPGAGEGARGYVGIAFRVQNDVTTYDAFYLRPTNGRADDQERRNHAVQYISHPDWPFFRLRKEAPSKYESYVDLMPGVWTKVKIEVRGERARLYVHDQEQPTLMVNDLKTGAEGKRRGCALELSRNRCSLPEPSCGATIDEVVKPTAALRLPLMPIGSEHSVRSWPFEWQLGINIGCDINLTSMPRELKKTRRVSVRSIARLRPSGRSL